MDDKVSTSAAFWDVQNLAPEEDATGDPDRFFISQFVE